MKPTTRLLAAENFATRIFGPKLGEGIYEFLLFGLKQATACVFAGSFLFLLAISSHISIPGLARYDFLFLSALAVGLCAAIYANFFTDHYIVDLRWPRAACVLLLFRRTQVRFTVTRAERRMPLALSFLLIGFFIWIAENIATYFGAWQYPNQKRQWAIVGPTKISSWMLLVIISFIIVAALKEIFPKNQQQNGKQEVVTSEGEPEPVIAELK
jgi:uncharacterized membrane protein YoaT (DUF817 family)